MRAPRRSLASSRALAGERAPEARPATRRRAHPTGGRSPSSRLMATRSATATGVASSAQAPLSRAASAGSGAAAPSALNDAARFEDASESDDGARGGAPAPNACERAEGDAEGDANGAAAASDDEFSEEEDEDLLAEALDWDFCEGAFARACVPRVPQERLSRGRGAWARRLQSTRWRRQRQRECVAA